MEELALFQVDDIESKQDKTFSKSTELVQKARHTLSAKELTLVDFMVSKVEETDDKLLEVQTTISEINEICRFGHGGAAYKNTEQALLNLANKGFWMFLEDGTKTIGRWLEKPYIKDGVTRLKLDSDLAPHLLNLVDGKKGQFYFRDVINLKSIYAKSLYELLRSFHTREVYLSKEKIIDLFNKQELEWYRVLPYLRKAKTDINKFTTMELDYDTIKEGRSTSGLLFKIGLKDKVVLDEDGNILN